MKYKNYGAKVCASENSCILECTNFVTEKNNVLHRNKFHPIFENASQKWDFFLSEFNREIKLFKAYCSSQEHFKEKLCRCRCNVKVATIFRYFYSIGTVIASLNEGGEGILIRNPPLSSYMLFYPMLRRSFKTFSITIKNINKILNYGIVI